MTTEAEAIAGAARVLATIWHEHDTWFAEGGAERVAREEFPNATPQRQAEIAARYEQLRQRAMRGSAA